MGEETGRRHGTQGDLQEKWISKESSRKWEKNSNIARITEEEVH